MSTGAIPTPRLPSSLHQAWLVACNDLAVMFRSRLIPVFVILVPVAMVLVTGLAFSGMERAAASAAPGEPGVAGAGQPVPGFNAFSQAVAGNGVMFILINCVMTGGMGLAREKRQSTLDRLMVSPMSKSTLIFGKLLGVCLVGAIQAVVIFGVGLLAGADLGDPAGVALVTLVFIVMGASLGLMVAALARREENVQMVGVPVCMVMTALGGGLFPFGMTPEWMQSVAMLMPTGWAMQAYYKLMWEGMGLDAVLPNLLMLAGFAAIFLMIGIRRLRWEQ